MNKQKFTHELQFFLKKRRGIRNPKITLDWVNDQGWESEIYAYTLTYGAQNKRGNETGVMRLLTGADFKGAQSEYRTLSLLYQAGYPVPEVYALGSPADGFNHPFILMQRVEGGDFAGRFPKTAGDDLKPLRDFINLFRRLHTLDWRPYVENPDEIAPPNQPFYHFDSQMTLFSQYLQGSGVIGFEPVMPWLSEHRALTACERASVVHRDFHHNNILEDSEGNLYVVDWTSAEISDYRFDLAWTLALALAYGGDFRREIVLKEYQRQMGAEIPGLEVFEVIAYVRRIGSAMISMQLGAEKLGMRPEAVAVMRRDRVAFERLFGRMRALTGLDLPEISAWVNTLG
jgi:aminoglycoside phosphotransferase (APT) family kinase protein